MINGPAFPVPGLSHDEDFNGMTLHDYASVHFAAAWTVVLGNTIMTEDREMRAAEAVRLGLLQAEEFINKRPS